MEVVRQNIRRLSKLQRHRPSHVRLLMELMRCKTHRKAPRREKRKKGSGKKWGRGSLAVQAPPIACVGSIRNHRKPIGLTKLVRRLRPRSSGSIESTKKSLTDLTKGAPSPSRHRTIIVFPRSLNSPRNIPRTTAEKQKWITAILAATSPAGQGHPHPVPPTQWFRMRQSLMQRYVAPAAFRPQRPGRPSEALRSTRPSVLHALRHP